MKKFSFLILMMCFSVIVTAETGYRLWLRYDLVSNPSRLNEYRNQIAAIHVPTGGSVLEAAKRELETGLYGLLGQMPAVSLSSSNLLAVSLGADADFSKKFLSPSDFNNLKDGFIIKTVYSGNKNIILIAADTDKGALYGVFHFLKLLQSHQDIQTLSIREVPRIEHRILNHWDNLDGTVERGYAGMSLWNWHKLPGYTETRYIDYARANASVGINGTVLNNVNSNSLVLSPDYIQKAASLADVFRPYGIRVYLSARFSAPVELGGLKTADPLDPEVQQWWMAKADEIYKQIPDFGGFLVKANSEGQPGPQNYGRSHADGANMLARALAPHGGIVMWRAFVYDNQVPIDRAMQAYNEFKPLDGKFEKNVLVQVKNGPIDFQPREPFHPLFGSMPATPLMMEFQITQEYLGLSTNLVYLGSLFEETLAADTYARGKNSTVAKVIDGSLDQHEFTGIAGVANTGSDVNWTGHQFGQANWYSYGRFAWNPELNAGDIAVEWIRMTFTNNETSLSRIKNIMMLSREAAVKYMTPLGLHHIMAMNHHWGPGPWVKDAGRADWTSVYYHRADSEGIGFDRTKTGSNYVSQYHPEVARQFADRSAVSDKYLLWFHRVKWDEKMRSGRTLWNELAHQYQNGVDSVKLMKEEWESVAQSIDPERFREVKQLLNIQYQEAKWWRDACMLYFQTFSRMPLPQGYEKPAHTLEYYQTKRFYFVPGI